MKIVYSRRFLARTSPPPARRAPPYYRTTAFSVASLS
jgi:hypothetical protein